jgi:hypothetical protein
MTRHLETVRDSPERLANGLTVVHKYITVLMLRR